MPLNFIYIPLHYIALIYCKQKWPNFSNLADPKVKNSWLAQNSTLYLIYYLLFNGRMGAIYL